MNVIAVLVIYSFHLIMFILAEERHQFCPEEAWCRWKQRKENVEGIYQLDPVFLNLLKPVFERLSESKLMER